jgi:hypothetical protein
MKLNIQHNYYPEDMVPYSVVRDHLRYDEGDAEELIKSYVASACDYMETLTNRVFCSSSPDLHEDDLYNHVDPADPLLATVEVYFNEDELNKVHYLRNITGSWTYEDTSLLYLHEDGQWLSLAGGETWDGFDDYTKAYVMTDTYPITIDWTKAGKPSDLHPRKKDVFKITFSGGDNVRELPRQFRQAMLLLVGHYDSQREAEYVGGLTTEIKEGVQRLLATVKVY